MAFLENNIKLLKSGCGAKKRKLETWVTLIRSELHLKAKETLTGPISDHCLKALILLIVPVALSGAAIFDEVWQ